MAKPRIFVSSTYYDLKYIRSDLERFIKDQGYEPVLNEMGHIPYGSQEKLEEYCYKEIELCDILISIIGGRFGSESKQTDYSISNFELKTAIERGKQVYIFIEQAVLSEFRTYEANKHNQEMVYIAVSDKRIYKFIEEVSALPLNNQIKAFDSVQEITHYLKEQWAGLFQRLLSENSRQREINIIKDITSVSKTLNQLVTYLIHEKEKGDQAIKDILLSNHPAFDEVRGKLGIPYRVFFQNKSELSQILEARFFEEESGFDGWEKPNYITWKKKKSDTFFRVNVEIFDDDGRLKIYSPADWKSDWIQIEEDDIPF